jgi:hypothetical protein
VPIVRQSVAAAHSPFFSITQVKIFGVVIRADTVRAFKAQWTTSNGNAAGDLRRETGLPIGPAVVRWSRRGPSCARKVQDHENHTSDEWATSLLAGPAAYYALRATFWNGRVAMLSREPTNHAETSAEIMLLFITAAVISVLLVIAIIYAV